MKYVCLIFTDENQLDKLSASAQAALEEEWHACLAMLRASGTLISSGSLQSVRSATTVRVRHDAVDISDGPSITTREQLSRFCVIDARDLNDAVRIAAKLPPARHGSVEVRPLTGDCRNRV
jgi:hypothetical protein